MNAEEGELQKISEWLDSVTEKRDGHIVVKESEKHLLYNIRGNKVTPLSAAYFVNFGEFMNNIADWRQSPDCKVLGCLNHRIRGSGISLRTLNPKDMTEGDRFYIRKYLDANSEPASGGCRLWTKKLNPRGYAIKSMLGVSHAHIISWILKSGRLPDRDKNEQVRHMCQKRPHCIASAHLQIGTAKENAQDRKRDGTQQYGDKHHTSKHSDTLARKVWESKGTGTQKERADRFNVKESFVADIDRGKRRKSFLSAEELAEAEKRPKKCRRLTAEQIQKVKDSKGTLIKRARITGVSLTSIKRINAGTHIQKPTSICANPEAYIKKTKARIEQRINRTKDEQGKEHWIAKKTTEDGYGRMQFYGHQRALHFIAWALYNNYPYKSLQPKEDGTKLVMRHGCKYRACCNPACLRGPGTVQENSLDAVQDRKATAKTAKLTEEQVHEIRESKESLIILAKRYKVGKTLIANVCNGSTYKSIPVRTPPKANPLDHSPFSEEN